MDPKFRNIFDSFHNPPGKCGFVAQLPDMDGTIRTCMVRYNRRVTDTVILITNITVHFNSQDVTCCEAVQAKIKAIEASCMNHAEQQHKYAETLLQTFQH